jgi:hypothetical protein
MLPNDRSRVTSSTLSTQPARFAHDRARRARSGRSSVTVKKKRRAATAQLILGGCMPICVWCSWERRRSSPVQVSGERPMTAANPVTAATAGSVQRPSREAILLWEAAQESRASLLADGWVCLLGGLRRGHGDRDEADDYRRPTSRRETRCVGASRVCLLVVATSRKITRQRQRWLRTFGKRRRRARSFWRQTDVDAATTQLGEIGLHDTERTVWPKVRTCPSGSRASRPCGPSPATRDQSCDCRRGDRIRRSKIIPV